MHWYAIGPTLTPLERAPAAETPGVVLLTSQELSQLSALPGLEETLRHTPAARDVRVCKAEVRPDCLSGTILFPKSDRGGGRLAFGWLMARNRAVLVDDGDFLLPYLRRMDKERYPVGGGVGRFSTACCLCLPPRTCGGWRRSRTRPRGWRTGSWAESWRASARR